MFQFPQSREDFMLFVQQVAREDVKKCLAGITTTHPELVQQFVSVSPKQQPSPTLYQQPPFIQQQPVISNNQPSSSPPPKFSSYSTTPATSNQEYTSHLSRNVSTNQNIAPSQTKNNPTPNSNHQQHVNTPNRSSTTTRKTVSPNSKRVQPPVAATNKSALKDKSPSPNEKVKKSPTEGKQVTISERLLKPTISMQKKFEKGQVKKPTSEKQFKDLRKEQNKSTSLLLKKKPITPKKDAKKSSPKQNISKTVSNESNISTAEREQENSEDESNIDNSQEEEYHEEIIETNLDISNISNDPSESYHSNESQSTTPKRSQPASASSSPKNQNSSTNSIQQPPSPKISPKREVSQPVIVNQSNSVQSKPSEKSLISNQTQPINRTSPTKSNTTNNNSEQPSISLISNHSNNPQYDQLEEMVLNDLLNELVREEHLANKKRAHQEIKLIEKRNQQNDKYDEILKLLTQLEQDEQSIRKRFTNKNYLLDSTMNSETSTSTTEEVGEEGTYDGLGVETIKTIQKFKRRNKKYFEAFCRPHDLSIDTLMQV